MVVSLVVGRKLTVAEFRSYQISLSGRFFERSRAQADLLSLWHPVPDPVCESNFMHQERCNPFSIERPASGLSRPKAA